MDNTLSLSWMDAEVSSRRSSYRRIVILSLVVQVAIGLFALIAPDTLVHLFHLPHPYDMDWPRAWGALLILMAAFYVPGLREPVRWRWSNILGIVGRAGMAIVYLILGGGFVWLALIEAVLALLLVIFYFGLFRAVVMAHP
jgi:hypothetical protein